VWNRGETICTQVTRISACVSTRVETCIRRCVSSTTNKVDSCVKTCVGSCVGACVEVSIVKVTNIAEVTMAITIIVDVTKVVVNIAASSASVMLVSISTSASS